MIVLAVVLKAEPCDLYVGDSSKFRKINRIKVEEGLQCIDSGFNNWLGGKVRGWLKSGSEIQGSPEKEFSTCDKRTGY